VKNKPHAWIACVFVLCLSLCLAACGDTTREWELIDQWSEPGIPEEFGGGIAAQDGQEILSFQGKSISQTVSVGLELTVPFMKWLSASVGYEVSQDSISLSGTSEILEKKGQSVTFYLQPMCEVFLVKDLDTGETHKVYNRPPNSIAYACVVKDTDGTPIKDTRIAVTSDPVAENTTEIQAENGNAYESTFSASVNTSTLEKPNGDVQNFNSRWASFYNGDGQFSGYGTYTYSDGAVYVGNAVNGRWEGHGTFTFANDGSYVGDFKDDTFNGQGTRTWANGDEYVGAWVNGSRTGQGSYTWASGNKYVGEFMNDEFDGRGTFTWADGNKYVGGFTDGKYDGQGILAWANGDEYVGGFKDGIYDGQGMLTLANGDEYVGEFEGWIYDGQGTFTWANGDKYVGAWVNGSRTGQGTYIWANGTKYVGEFVDGKRTVGTILRSDGSTEPYPAE
jgi:hypothetical protein